MKSRFIACATLAAVTAGMALSADEMVAIQIRGHYFPEPANVHVLVTIEPSPENRILRIEADGDSMFRSSQVELSGSGEKRLHAMQFKNLAAGNYMLRAEVLTADEKVIAMAEEDLVVTGR